GAEGGARRSRAGVPALGAAELLLVQLLRPGAVLSAQHALLVGPLGADPRRARAPRLPRHELQGRRPSRAGGFVLPSRCALTRSLPRFAVRRTACFARTVRESGG